MTEAARHELYQRLVELVGSEPAETLMSHLPPTGWADVATVHTQQQLADQLRAEMGGLRSDLEGGMAGLRVEMSQLRSDLEGGMAGLRVELHDGLRRQTYAVLGGVLAVNGIVAAATGLL